VVKTALGILVEVGKKRRLITYGQFSAEFNFRLGRKVLSPVSASRLIRKACLLAYPKFGVFPGSVVVSKRKGMPSKGYFEFLRTFGISWSDERQIWLKLLNEFYEFCGVISEEDPL